MRYIITLFWAFVLGQVVGYLGSSLAGGTYDFTATTIASLIVGVIAIAIGTIAVPKKDPQQH